MIFSLFNMKHLFKEKLVKIRPRQFVKQPNDVTQTCYDDVMLFLEALVGVHENQTGTSTYQSMDWAIRGKTALFIVNKV